MDKRQLLGALARGYCTERNGAKVTDPDLVADMADEVERLLATEQPLEVSAWVGEISEPASALLRTWRCLGLWATGEAFAESCRQTWANCTIHRTLGGNDAVEARDPHGNVLARAKRMTATTRGEALL